MTSTREVDFEATANLSRSHHDGHHPAANLRSSRIVRIRDMAESRTATDEWWSTVAIRFTYGRDIAFCSKSRTATKSGVGTAITTADDVNVYVSDRRSGGAITSESGGAETAEKRMLRILEKGPLGLRTHRVDIIQAHTRLALIRGAPWITVNTMGFSPSEQLVLAISGKRNETDV